jgi:hypothetical protein
MVLKYVDELPAMQEGLTFREAFVRRLVLCEFHLTRATIRRMVSCVDQLVIAIALTAITVEDALDDSAARR